MLNVEIESKTVYALHMDVITEEKSILKRKENQKEDQKINFHFTRALFNL